MEISFKGKRVLITGATKGIGRGVARLMDKLGATVIAVCCNKTWLDELKAELPGIELVQADLGNWEESKAALANVGPIDLLVNNVGVNVRASFMEVTEENFDLHASINLKSTFAVSQIAAQSMIERGTGGAIVNISSVGAYFPTMEMPIYCALKEATVNLTKTMALELAKHKIRVNSVAPGAINTEMGKMVTESEALMKHLEKTLPLGRIIEPEELAKSVAFLLSDHASVITGSTLLVDGGYLLNPPFMSIPSS